MIARPVEHLSRPVRVDVRDLEPGDRILTFAIPNMPLDDMPENWRAVEEEVKSITPVPSHPDWLRVAFTTTDIAYDWSPHLASPTFEPDPGEPRPDPEPVYPVWARVRTKPERASAFIEVHAKDNGSTWLVNRAAVVGVTSTNGVTIIQTTAAPSLMPVTETLGEVMAMLEPDVTQ